MAYDAGSPTGDSWAFHPLVRLVGVDWISDTQCGLKLFRGAVAHVLFSRMRTTGFSSTLKS